MNAPLLRTENIQTTIGAINNDFAGRKECADYDPTKLIHIHRRNRAFVWKPEMQKKLFDSIMKGYYIPPIICSSNIENGVEKRYVMEGGNRITTFRNLLNTNKVKKLTDEERSKVDRYPITIVVMRNLTSKQQREMFRRLNKSIRVSDGQLFAMSEDDSPLVQEAIAFLEDDKYPLRDLMVSHFGELKGKDTDAKGNLANAVALISGAIYGPKFITTAFNIQEEKIELIAPVNRASITTMLGNVFEVFNMADQKITISSRQKKGQFTVGRYLGAILYDLHTNPGMSQKVQQKWCNYLIKVREGVPGAEEVVNPRGAQNLNPDKLKRISEAVRIFIEENRIASREELKQCKHSKVDVNSSDDDSEEDNSDVEEEEEEEEERAPIKLINKTVTKK
jgi:hypothetical protein